MAGAAHLHALQVEYRTSLGRRHNLVAHEISAEEPVGNDVVVEIPRYDLGIVTKARH